MKPKFGKIGSKVLFWSKPGLFGTLFHGQTNMVFKLLDFCLQTKHIRYENKEEKTDRKKVFSNIVQICGKKKLIYKFKKQREKN